MLLSGIGKISNVEKLQHHSVALAISGFPYDPQYPPAQLHIKLFLESIKGWRKRGPACCDSWTTCKHRLWCLCIYIYYTHSTTVISSTIIDIRGQLFSKITKKLTSNRSPWAFKILQSLLVFVIPVNPNRPLMPWFQRGKPRPPPHVTDALPAAKLVGQNALRMWEKCVFIMGNPEHLDMMGVVSSWILIALRIKSPCGSKSKDITSDSWQGKSYVYNRTKAWQGPQICPCQKPQRGVRQLGIHPQSIPQKTSNLDQNHIKLDQQKRNTHTKKKKTNHPTPTHPNITPTPRSIELYFQRIADWWCHNSAVFKAQTERVLNRWRIFRLLDLFFDTLNFFPLQATGPNDSIRYFF